MAARGLEDVRERGRGTDPDVTCYTHISDQYAPVHTKVINVTVRDATHVLDALLKQLSALGWEHLNLTGDYVLRR